MNSIAQGRLAYLTHPSKFEPRDYRRPGDLRRIDRVLDAALRRASRSRVLADLRAF